MLITGKSYLGGNNFNVRLICLLLLRFRPFHDPGNADVLVEELAQYMFPELTDNEGCSTCSELLGGFPAADWTYEWKHMSGREQ